VPLFKNKENQSIDFRLLITKKGKPRFFLLCQQSGAPERGLETDDKPSSVTKLKGAVI